MKFSIPEAQAILQRTPGSVISLLDGLPANWTDSNEGGNSWNAFDVVAHLLYCDRHNWVLRARHLLTTGTMLTFDPLDRSGGKGLSAGLTLSELLERFRETRKEVLAELEDLRIRPDQYNASGMHPEFGEVTLSQLLSAWVVHDLSHLSQISRILAHQYRQEVGPWITYLRILN